jgi:hypothetical protein
MRSLCGCYGPLRIERHNAFQVEIEKFLSVLIYNRNFSYSYVLPSSVEMKFVRSVTYITYVFSSRRNFCLS